MGDNLGDVRIHTGPQAAKACEDINARAFTVGNHVAFNTGEYDPESPEGQHVLAHELAHVRQQTGGAVSMLPDKGEFRIDPDERLEREAEQTAERVMRGGAIGVPGMRKADVHVQRIKQNEMFGALALFEIENEQGDVGQFQQDQNDTRMQKMREWIEEFNEGTNEVERQLNDLAAQDLIKDQVQAHGGEVNDGRIDGPEELTDEILDHEEAKDVLQKDLPSKSELEQRKQNLENELADKLEQVALTEDQREKLDAGVERDMLGKLGEKAGFALLAKIDPVFKVVKGAYESVKNNWGTVDGDIVERAVKLREELLDEVAEDWTPEKTTEVDF